MDDLTLPELLHHCCDRSSPKHQLAWSIFLTRYKKFLYYNVTRRCKEWNITRLKLQFKETVDDIVCSVIKILCDDDFRALRNFHNTDDERMFRWYLVTICQNACSRYMKKFLLRYVDYEPDENEPHTGDMAIDALGQIYESVVKTLRNSAKKERENLERDINLFLLTVWGNLDKNMIMELPCYRGKITPRIIDNAVFRMREVLREKGLPLK
jgi:hypothetical protein